MEKMNNATHYENGLNVGDLIFIEDAYREVLSVEVVKGWRSDQDQYHVAFMHDFGACVRLYAPSSLKDIQNVTDRAPVLAKDAERSKYGTPYEAGQTLLTLSLRVRSDGYQRILDFIFDRVEPHLKRDFRSIENPVALHSPVGEGSSISLYLTDKDRARNRRTTMKCGRAFRHMVPSLDAATVARMAEDWVEMNSPREFVLKVGDQRADFRRAYCGVRADYRNPTTTSVRKSIATSCMHATKVQDGSEDLSPAEVFASGDFKIAWLETVTGQIAGRVVFSCKEGRTATHAPIYGACEQSLDMLSNYLTELDVSASEDWAGLRLLNIEADQGTVGPYLDCGLHGVINGNYIDLCDDGDITFERTDGYTDYGIMCEHCGGSVSEDEVYQTDEGCLCTHCFDESYVYLESGEICPLEEAVEANCMGWNNRVTTTWVHIDDSVFCELVEEYWVIDEVTVSACGECIPTHRVGDFPELFPNDEEEAA